jgi:CMP-2-keto-3-deoxyoctulosonic acid synthetase
MAKFYISDVMKRKQDNTDIGYLIVIKCEGDKNSIDTTLFVQKEDIPDATKENIKALAEKWLNTKEGMKTIAETIESKLAIIEDERIESLIDSSELVIYNKGRSC